MRLTDHLTSSSTKAGTRPSIIRWVKSGLIPTEPRKSAKRGSPYTFTDDTALVLRRVDQLRRAGLSLEECRLAIDLLRNQDGRAGRELTGVIVAIGERVIGRRGVPRRIELKRVRDMQGVTTESGKNDYPVTFVNILPDQRAAGNVQVSSQHE